MKLAFKCLCPCRWTLNRTKQFALNGAIQNLLKDEKYCNFNHYKGLFIPVILSMKSVALKSMYMIRVGWEAHYTIKGFLGKAITGFLKTGGIKGGGGREEGDIVYILIQL